MEALDKTMRLIYNKLDSIAVPNTHQENVASFKLAMATPTTIGINDKYPHIDNRECKINTDKKAENKGSAALITCTKETEPDVNAITVATFPKPWHAAILLTNENVGVSEGERENKNVAKF